MEGDSLQHYGVKGMKWGQHIFTKEEKKPQKFLNVILPLIKGI